MFLVTRVTSPDTADDQGRHQSLSENYRSVDSDWQHKENRSVKRVGAALFSWRLHAPACALHSLETTKKKDVGTVDLIWPGNTTGSSRKTWSVLLGRDASALLKSVCCPSDPVPESIRKTGGRKDEECIRLMWTTIQGSTLLENHKTAWHFISSTKCALYPQLNISLWVIPRPSFSHVEAAADIRRGYLRPTDDFH